MYIQICLVIGLCYRQKLVDGWKEEALKVARELESELAGNIKRSAGKCARTAPTKWLNIVGRARGQKVCADADFVWEALAVEGRSLNYKQVAGSFTQPNGFMCQKMLSWGLDVTRPTLIAAETSTLTSFDCICESNDHTKGDLLELYCGNGNFSLAVAPNFRRVVGTELSKVSVAAANENIQVNGIQNVTIAQSTAEDVARALAGQAQARMGKTHLRLFSDDYCCSTILVDPPRAGLDPLTRKLVKRFPTIVYISCNPETAHRDLLEITETHILER